MRSHPFLFSCLWARTIIAAHADARAGSRRHSLRNFRGSLDHRKVTQKPTPRAADDRPDPVYAALAWWRRRAAPASRAGTMKP